MASTRHDRPSPLWWIYFALCVMLFAIGTIANIRLGSFSSLSAAWANAPSYCIDFSCLVGLYGYLRSRAFFAAGVWQVILGVYVVKIAFGEAVFIYGYWKFPHAGNAFYVTLFGLLALPIAAPMIVALWLYAFRPARLWRQGEA